MINKLTRLSIFKVYQLFLFLFIDLTVGGILVYLYAVQIISSSIIFVVFSIIVFLMMGSILQELFQRMFDLKQKKFMNNPKCYSLDSLEIMDENLIKKNAKKDVFDFGNSYLYIKNKVAYKVVVVYDSVKYFSEEKPEVNKKTKPNKKLAECEKFIGFEIFNSMDNVIIEKTRHYTFQSDKFYYGGFYYNQSTHQLIQSNYEEPNNNHAFNYASMIELLGVIE